MRKFSLKICAFIAIFSKIAMNRGRKCADFRLIFGGSRLVRQPLSLLHGCLPFRRHIRKAAGGGRSAFFEIERDGALGRTLEGAKADAARELIFPGYRRHDGNAEAHAQIFAHVCIVCLAVTVTVPALVLRNLVLVSFIVPAAR